MEIQDFPVKLEELCSFTFNFENLIRIIQFLHKSHNDLVTEVRDLTKKVLLFEDVKSQIGDLQVKQRTTEISQKEMGETLSNLQSKLLEIDSKMSNIDQKAFETNEKIIKYDSQLFNHEDNINKLNKIVEEHLKDSKEINEKITNCINQNEENISSINTIKEDVNNLKSSQNEINIDEIINQIADTKSEIETLKENVDRNHSDNQHSISNILQTITEIKSGNNNIGIQERKRTSIKNKPSNISEEEIRETTENVKYSQTQIENLQVKFETLINKINEEKEGDERELKEAIKRIEELEIKYSDINEDLDDITQIAKLPRRRSTLKNDINVNQEELKNRVPRDINAEINVEYILNIFLNSKEYKKINDNLRIITSSVGDKIGRDDIDNLQKALNARISKIEDKINDYKGSGSSIPNKLKNNISNQNTGIDMEFLQQNLEAQINEEVKNVTKEYLRNESKLLDLTQNPSILSLLESINKQEEEINKNYKSIIDIRDMLITNDQEKQMNEIKKKLVKLDEDNRNAKAKLYELAKNLEGSEEEEEAPLNNNNNDNSSPTIQEPHQGGLTFKEKINVLTATCQNLNEKVKNLEKKNAALTREVKDDIKQNLKNETQKVVENFKLKLDSFSNKFEHELKNKIDHMGLSSFEHKINNKFYGDLREKLDKNELRKNNNVINRKIDSLENKISKTLVDTIIDLQMDDQPLLLKKNAKNMDKCASCGQNLPQPYYEQINNINQSVGLNKSKFKYTISGKDKLPEINEKNSSG